VGASLLCDIQAIFTGGGPAVAVLEFAVLSTSSLLTDQDFTLSGFGSVYQALTVGIYFRRAARLPRLSQGRKEHCVLVRVSRIVPCFIALATSETDDEYERMPLKFSSMRPGFFQGLFEEV
jgi:hypothetical protein